MSDHLRKPSDQTMWAGRARRVYSYIEHVLLIVMALETAGVFASYRSIYYEMSENRTIAASSKK